MNIRLSRLGLPDLPERAFDGSGRLWGKSDPPPAPDYAAAAQQTAAGNLENARYATIANRPNEITPWGSRTWTNNTQFDQGGYDAALAAFNRSSQSPPSGSQGGHWETRGSGGDEGMWQEWVPGGQPGQTGQPASAMPNRDDFMTGGDNWTSQITLSPEMQALFDQQQKLQTGLFGAQDQALGRVNDMMGRGFDMSGIPQAGTALDVNGLPSSGTAFGGPRGDLAVYDPTQSTNTATEAIMARVNPQLDRQEAALRTQLANQGISQGSQAWNNAMDELNRTKNDAFTQAGLQGIGLGMQQQGQTFGQGVTNRQLSSGEQAQQFSQQNYLRQLAAALQGQQFGQQQGLRGQAMQEQAYLRNLPMNELNALRSGNQVQQPQFGGFSQQATTAGPDMLGAAQGQYNAALGANNAQNASSSSMMGGLMGLGQMGMMGSAMGLFGGGGLAGIGAVPAGLMAGIPSDRRLKTNIKPVGKADNGLTIYTYNYVWGGPAQLGFMADEVQKVAPDAVGELDGYLTVDYSRVH